MIENRVFTNRKLSPSKGKPRRGACRCSERKERDEIGEIAMNELDELEAEIGDADYYSQANVGVVDIDREENNK